MRNAGHLKQLCAFENEVVASWWVRLWPSFGRTVSAMAFGWTSQRRTNRSLVFKHVDLFAGCRNSPTLPLMLSRFLSLGGPIMGMRMATFVLWLLLHIFLGHLGIAQLSAGLLGFTVFRGTTVSVLVNLSTGLNTIGGQVPPQAHFFTLFLLYVLSV